MVFQQWIKCLLVYAAFASFASRCFYWPTQPAATLGLESMEESSYVKCPPTDVPRATFYPIRFFDRQNTRLVESLEQNKVYSETDYLVLGNQTSSAFSVYYHVHKAGGTAMYTSFHATADAYYHRVNQASRTRGEGAHHQSSRLQVMQKTFESQNTSYPVIMFTFVRDPALRFLSSVGELLGTQASHQKIVPCTEKETTAQLLECVLDKIEESSLFLDVRLLPQSYELLYGVMGYDIAVDIIDLSNVDAVIRGCNGTPDKNTSSRSGHLIRRYPKFHLTTDASSDSIWDRICRLYEADERMLQGLGTIDTLCGMR
jgi:hypothetical protein